MNWMEKRSKASRCMLVTWEEGTLMKKINRKKLKKCDKKCGRTEPFFNFEISLYIEEPFYKFDVTIGADFK